MANIVHIVLEDNTEFDLNKKEIISIGTNDNVTWRVVCVGGVQFDTNNTELINELKS